jgi:ankyrin repeat protein
MRAFLERLIKDGNQDDVDTYRITPLMYACKFGNFSLVKTLLDAGVNTNKINIDGDSAVMYAVNNSNRTDGAEIVTTLIKHGVDIDSNINKKSEYPLLIAAKMDNQQCFKALLPYSAWCRHHIDKHGYSAVSYANKNNCKHELDKFFLEIMLKNGYNILGHCC